MRQTRYFRVCARAHIADSATSLLTTVCRGETIAPFSRHSPGPASPAERNLRVDDARRLPLLQRTGCDGLPVRVQSRAETNRDDEYGTARTFGPLYRWRNMNRTALVVMAAVLGWLWTGAAAQSQQLLRVKILLIDSDLNVKPVPKHVLFVTPRPTPGEPRRLVMGMDGSAETSLAPGDYVIESEKPVEFQGKSYRWAQSFTMKAGIDSVLELSVDNATIESNTPKVTVADLPSLFRDWQDSVVTV